MDEEFLTRLLAEDDGWDSDMDDDETDEEDDPIDFSEDEEGSNNDI